jgi:hypothetical protein
MKTLHKRCAGIDVHKVEVVACLRVDASWLADLLAHGLIRPSFVPPVAIQELRDLTRTHPSRKPGRARSSHLRLS